MPISNPFIISGYQGEHYFCDREVETDRLISLLSNGNNVALISPRRMGKTGLIRHCFAKKEVAASYYTFVVDIYATKNLQEFVFEMGRTVLNTLKPRGRRTWEKFVSTLGSLRGSISFDINGNPEWGLGMGDIKVPETTLDEIFFYLQQADKPCVVAIDEFQTVDTYPEKSVEAMLRTRIQQCSNCMFIFSGSQRRMMSEIFLSPSRPFYQSTSLMSLDVIDKDKYQAFAMGLFEEYGKHIEKEAVARVYEEYDGITWYVQSVLNTLFSMTEKGDVCTVAAVGSAVRQILDQQSFAYSALLYQLPARQKEVFLSICKDEQVANITSKNFLRQHNLTASQVQGAVKGLLEKDFITNEMGLYKPYDKFFSQWLKLQ